jgi:hypothetical protein
MTMQFFVKEFRTMKEAGTVWNHRGSGSRSNLASSQPVSVGNPILLQPILNRDGRITVKLPVRHKLVERQSV